MLFFITVKKVIFSNFPHFVGDHRTYTDGSKLILDAKNELGTQKRIPCSISFQYMHPITLELTEPEQLWYLTLRYLMYTSENLVFQLSGQFSLRFP